jgi:phosphomannomutase
MRENDIIIAGEESGGLSIKNHIPEKDGILADLLIMEMMAYENKTLSEIHREFLNSLNRQFLNNRIDLKLESKEEQELIINKFKTYNKIGNYNVVKTNIMDGLKLYLEDESWILIRKSGTEPLLRIYFESDTCEKMLEFEKIIKELC